MTFMNDPPDVFRNKDLLEHSYQPDDIVGRDDQKDEFRIAIYSAYAGNRPDNIFLHGPPGTGKTAFIKHVLPLVQEDAKTDNEVTLTNLYHNCRVSRSEYQVTVSLVNDLREHQHGSGNYDELPELGLPANQINNALYEELENVGGTILFVLDEIDALDNPEFFYSLPRAHQSGRLPRDVNVGIIGISNSAGFLDNLDPEVEDTLEPHIIRFGEYNASALEDILRARAEEAFYPGVLDNRTVPWCAARGAAKDGSARYALRLLREAGKIAIGKNTTTVKQVYAEEAEEKIERESTKEDIRESSLHAQFALLAVLDVAARGNTFTRTTDIIDTYEEFVDDCDYDPLSYDPIRKALKKFEQQRLIESERNYDDGQYLEFKLRVDLETALEAFDGSEDAHRYTPVLKEILTTAWGNRLISEDFVESLETIQMNSRT